MLTKHEAKLKNLSSKKCQIYSFTQSCLLATYKRCAPLLNLKCMQHTLRSELKLHARHLLLPKYSVAGKIPKRLIIMVYCLFYWICLDEILSLVEMVEESHHSHSILAVLKYSMLSILTCSRHSVWHSVQSSWKGKLKNGCVK